MQRGHDLLRLIPRDGSISYDKLVDSALNNGYGCQKDIIIDLYQLSIRGLIECDSEICSAMLPQSNIYLTDKGHELQL